MNRHRIQPGVAVELETVSLRLPAQLVRAVERYAKYLGGSIDRKYVITCAIRFVSTPRWPKDLSGAGPVKVNRETLAGAPREPASASDWRPESLAERLRIELTPRAWKRLVRAAAARGASVEQLLRSTLPGVV